ncbi:hypothetical protein [Cryobacterium sp. PH29-G1]|uniref:hypothetical protein n=1 Tax=Cryobacterium sp. PH29-G1 TaxID=3046211 RepID=UPI0024B98AF9|nr:hypothetical protein [Cryobacterium sp. PH29-G1]MDJ0349107.1 hypothetical protein [Cryobacterium sp. PH29-G1]
MISVSIVVDDSHTAGIVDVAARLRAAGMSVENVLDTVGIITGSVSEQQLGALGRVEGVESVDRDRQVHLPPPEDDVQ